MPLAAPVPELETVIVCDVVGVLTAVLPKFNESGEAETFGVGVTVGQPPAEPYWKRYSARSIESDCVTGSYCEIDAISALPVSRGLHWPSASASESLFRLPAPMATACPVKTCSCSLPSGCRGNCCSSTRSRPASSCVERLAVAATGRMGRRRPREHERRQKDENEAGQSVHRFISVRRRCLPGGSGYFGKVKCTSNYSIVIARCHRTSDERQIPRDCGKQPYLYTSYGNGMTAGGPGLRRRRQNRARIGADADLNQLAGAGNPCPIRGFAQMRPKRRVRRHFACPASRQAGRVSCCPGLAPDSPLV